MSIEHLKLLRKRLEQSKWIVREELSGNDSDIAGIWSVSRPNGDSAFNLVFEGMDEIKVLPMNKSYGCYIENNKEIGLYFGKIGKSFPNESEDFMNSFSEYTS